jgi:ketosteroid isomerase-like protein
MVMKKYCSLLLIASGFLYTSCTETQTEKMGSEAGTKDSVEFDMSKAKDYIQAENAKFVEEAKRGDSNAMAAHYAPDGWLMLNGAEPMKGRDIASGWGQAIRMGMKDMKINTVDVIGNADLLAETGTYEMYGDNNKLLDKGKYVVVWKPENGGWKIYRDIGNSNMPPQGTKK